MELGLGGWGKGVGRVREFGSGKFRIWEPGSPGQGAGIRWHM